jgi:hypothetical protein
MSHLENQTWGTPNSRHLCKGCRSTILAPILMASDSPFRIGATLPHDLGSRVF